MTQSAAHTYLDHLLEEVVTRDASDLYITVGCPPQMRVEGQIIPFEGLPLTQRDIEAMVDQLVDDEKKHEFSTTLEMNFAINWKEKSRFRINLFRQQQYTGIVLRRIRTNIPHIEGLGLHPVYAFAIMKKRGLILLVGATGTGKSTSLAAMLDYRNKHGSGHIITVEDPIEFVHSHQNCIFTQREVGIDTYSYSMALKNALRQRADVVVIGEIRDRETMEHAMYFAETGHLCIATLHANNTTQAIERITNFFPEELHRQVLMTLAQNLEIIISQKMVKNLSEGATMVAEIMLNVGLVKTLIEEGKIRELREAMERSHDKGMQTFDQVLFGLFSQGIISRDTALEAADNPPNLRLKMVQAGGSSDGSRLPPSVPPGAVNTGLR